MLWIPAFLDLLEELILVALGSFFNPEFDSFNWCFPLASNLWTNAVIYSTLLCHRCTYILNRWKKIVVCCNCKHWQWDHSWSNADNFVSKLYLYKSCHRLWFTLHQGSIEEKRASLWFALTEGLIRHEREVRYEGKDFGSLLVACTKLYETLCRSVRLSVRRRTGANC